MCSITQVDEFLGLTPGNSDESKLLTLINGLSDYLEQLCSRQFGVQYISELRNGTGQHVMYVLNPPVQKGFAVHYLGSLLQMALTDNDSGVIWDSESVSLRGGSSKGLFASRFPEGRQNVRLEYLSGWALPNQTTNDWQSAHAYYPRATIKPTSNNAGGFIYEYQARRYGGSASSASSRPQFNQTAGSVTADSGVAWTNLGVTTMPDVLPLMFQEACAEIVATRYRQQSRWADVSSGVGPERVSYFMGDMSASTKAAVGIMTNVNPVLT